MQKESGIAVWIAGVVFGIVAALGYLFVPEPGLALLWAMFSTMVLGCWRPERPWRWTLLVGLIVPIGAVVHKIIRPEQVTRGLLYGSLLASVPAILGAYGGSFMRRTVETVFLKKDV